MRGPKKVVTERARSLRKQDNDAERKLWQALKDRRLNGYKFVRQFPIGPYYADFVCRESKLVVEVDGSQHAESEYDRRRDIFMKKEGYAVIRFWNVDVLNNSNAVLETIVAALDGRLHEETTANDLIFTGYSRGKP
ncbi:endonuclease domain-containing protein [Mesorhizobium sp. RMAD-H1]|uniref:endonuclease domain-containing protein n=1 Tax=Mesorhizobium sp. RMAD-H1 TaxID=2587065 RepID=UPI001622A380|nr:endonuclease domain-containing protein [Mesorhizobium sp. RMAD-H1]MBB2971063.1 very-short-patch-repair endonuclease [Mesorhizobium sp. RMAD-H1]